MTTPYEMQAVHRDAAELIRKAELARVERLHNQMKIRDDYERALALAQKTVREHPIEIARLSAEIARLEATTGAEIVRQMLEPNTPVLPPLERPEWKCPDPPNCNDKAHPECWA